MLKVYVTAITVNLSLEAGQWIGKNDLIVKFLKGAWRLNPPRPQTVPSWDLSIVLRALRGTLFQPLGLADFWPLSLKMALHLALQTLSVSASCLEFGPNDCKIFLRPKHGYAPKMLSTPFRAQVLTQ